MNCWLKVVTGVLHAMNIDFRSQQLDEKKHSSPDYVDANQGGQQTNDESLEKTLEVDQ